MILIYKKIKIQIKKKLIKKILINKSTLNNSLIKMKNGQPVFEKIKNKVIKMSSKIQKNLKVMKNNKNKIYVRHNLIKISFKNKIYHNKILNNKANAKS